MRLSNATLVGGALGFLVGLLMAGLAALQYDRDATTLGQVLGVSLALGLPIAVSVGALAGFIWERLFLR